MQEPGLCGPGSGVASFMLRPVIDSVRAMKGFGHGDCRRVYSILYQTQVKMKEGKNSQGGLGQSL